MNLNEKFNIRIKDLESKKEVDYIFIDLEQLFGTDKINIEK